MTDERHEFEDQDEGKQLYERLRDDQREKAKKLKDQLERGLTPRGRGANRESEAEDPGDDKEDG